MPLPKCFQPGRVGAILKHATSRNTGLLLGAVLSLFPPLQQKYFPILSDFLSEVGIPLSISNLISFVLLGYASVELLNWIRWRAVKALLTYQGWKKSPKSWISKTWAMLVRCLSGPCPYSTYQFQKCLPHLPVPALDATLARWLQVVKPLLKTNDYQITCEHVEEFRRNKGPILQKHLLEKSSRKGSWIDDYWLNGVYLSSRKPLVVNSNISGQLVVPEYRTTDPLARAAAFTNLIARFHRMVENEDLPPAMLLNTVPMCMNGFKRLFNTVRVPEVCQDQVVTHPGYSHVIVIRKGHYFKIDLRYHDGTLLTTEEIKLLLQTICKMADGELQAEQPIAALTGQQRDLWAKDFHESARMSMTGNVQNIWFDKSFSYTVYGNGTIVAANADHTSYDAVVPSTMLDYILVLEDYIHGDVKKETLGPRPLKTPQKLSWDVSHMKEEISAAAKQLSDLAEDIDLKLYNAKYGKGFMKKCRLSPDGYIQMILQLAYYKLHKEIVRTYEPASLRLFYLGRTETINPVSETSVDWVKSMCDETSNKETRKDLLVKAVKYQTAYRLAATTGNGCDRHLFALMCASWELGVDMPKLFIDKAWQMPYKLSTSQTPTQMFEFGAECDYRYTCWGFGPSCYDGYAISYIILGDKILNFHVVSYNGCETTNSAKFVHSLEEAMEEMQELFHTS